jgi:hypothetical protein
MVKSNVERHPRATSGATESHRECVERSRQVQSSGGPRTLCGVTSTRVTNAELFLRVRFPPLRRRPLRCVPLLRLLPALISDSQGPPAPFANPAIVLSIGSTLPDSDRPTCCTMTPMAWATSNWVLPAFLAGALEEGAVELGAHARLNSESAGYLLRRLKLEWPWRSPPRLAGFLACARDLSRGRSTRRVAPPRGPLFRRT